MSLFTDKIIGYFSSAKQRVTCFNRKTSLGFMHIWVNSFKVDRHWLQVLNIRSERWKFYSNSLKTYWPPF